MYCHLHRNLNQFEETVKTADAILERFNGRGVQGILNPSPTRIVEQGTELIKSENLIQCAQDTWDVRVSIIHRPDFSDSRISVSLQFKEEDAFFEAILRCHLASREQGTLCGESIDGIIRSLRLIQFSMGITEQSMIHGFDRSIFNMLIEKLS
jgi:hypothetical protein